VIGELAVFAPREGLPIFAGEAADLRGGRAAGFRTFAAARLRLAVFVACAPRFFAVPRVLLVLLPTRLQLTSRL
jgi:hypothetical protein